MKLCLLFCLFLMLSVISTPVFSQNSGEKEVEISGTKYILHTVKKSETSFSLCQKYQVSQADLQKANPGLTAVLEAGATIKIPKGKVVSEPQVVENKTQAQPTEEYYYHKVNKNQTIFSIAKQYGVSENDLIKNNPELLNGISVGQVLKIPVNITKTKEQSIAESAIGSGSQPNMNGYLVHVVASGETLYSLEHKYEISHDEMMALNPDLESGLKAGMKLKVPNKQPGRVEEPASVNQNYTKYKVESGETLFSLAARFGVDVSDIKKANPSLFSRSLESGETILIPQQSNAQKGKQPSEVDSNSLYTDKNKDAENVGCQPISGKNNQKYKAALLLPFYLPGNDQLNVVSLNKAMMLSKISFNNQPVSNIQDSATSVTGTNVDQKAIGFLEFYEGVIIAIDSLQELGMNIELFVFDASNQQMVNSLLQMDEFRDMNLIIGPVLPEFQESVSSFAAKNRIPMISPLSASGNFELSNSFYFKVNPSREYQIEQSAQYIEREFSDKNFILLQVAGNSASPEAKLAQLSKERLSVKSPGNLFHEYNFQTQGVNTVKSILNETGENIFLIPSDNEAQVSISVTNLTALAENYNVVLMGTPTLTKMKSLQTENFHKIRLRYLTPYFVDYTRPLVRRFIGQYRDYFSTEPSQYSFQGFDVSYYFLSALFKFGKDFRNCVPEYPMELTQMDFNFRKVSSMGGYMNHSLFVNSYERNFDVLNFDVVVGK
jgi:LysM repeat protein/ABC-type branched-subunit amino acid transport system substrate-binding protein